MCSHCGLHLSSLKAKSLHGASCGVTEGHIENATERVRPLRVAARWQREIDEVDAEDFDLSNITDVW